MLDTCLTLEDLFRTVSAHDVPSNNPGESGKRAGHRTVRSSSEVQVA